MLKHGEIYEATVLINGYCVIDGHVYRGYIYSGMSWDEDIKVVCILHHSRAKVDRARLFGARTHKMYEFETDVLPLAPYSTACGREIKSFDIDKTLNHAIAGMMFKSIIDTLGDADDMAYIVDDYDYETELIDNYDNCGFYATLYLIMKYLYYLPIDNANNLRWRRLILSLLQQT